MPFWIWSSAGAVCPITTCFRFCCCRWRVLQIVAFTELVIKRLRYTLRLFVFAVPYLAVLSAIAAGFGWLPAAQPGAWALFFLIFLAVLLTMTLGFELYYRISGKKYDGLLGQYRASRTRDENSRGEY